MPGGEVKGIGIDIVEIPRMSRAIDRWGSRFTGRIFTTGELEYARRSRNPAQHLSARFAGKEAVAKALGTGFVQGVRMSEIEIVNDRTGRPLVRLHGAARRLADKAGVGRILMTLSHGGGTAVAQAIAVGRGEDEEGEHAIP